MKKCTKCLVEKPITEFYKSKGHKDGFNYRCKVCVRAYFAGRREYKKAYDERNAERQKEYFKEHYRKNKDRVRAYAKANAHKTAKRMRRYVKERMARDPLFKIMTTARRAAYKALTSFLKGKQRSRKEQNYIGCTSAELKSHIEFQFQPGMTWENMGQWEIDHKVAISTAKSEAEILALSHYSNLQPLWRSDNRTKGNRTA